MEAARLAVRFGCTPAEVRAMTPRDIEAMTAVHDERDRARARARAKG